MTEVADRPVVFYLHGPDRIYNKGSFGVDESAFPALVMTTLLAGFGEVLERTDYEPMTASSRPAVIVADLTFESPAVYLMLGAAIVLGIPIVTVRYNVANPERDRPPAPLVDQTYDSVTALRAILGNSLETILTP